MQSWKYLRGFKLLRNGNQFDVLITFVENLPLRPNEDILKFTLCCCPSKISIKLSSYSHFDAEICQRSCGNTPTVFRFIKKAMHCFLLIFYWKYFKSVCDWKEFQNILRVGWCLFFINIILQIIFHKHITPNHRTK